MAPGARAVAPGCRDTALCLQTDFLESDGFQLRFDLWDRDASSLAKDDFLGRYSSSCTLAWHAAAHGTDSAHTAAPPCTLLHRRQIRHRLKSGAKALGSS